MTSFLCVPDAAAMEAVGARLALLAHGGLCIHLRGELAAGKTTFARGYLRALGHRGAVKSPTFTLVESYALARRYVHHFDLYRLAAPLELEFIGIDDYFSPSTECLIEWPEKGAGVLPPADLDIAIEIAGSARELSVQAFTAAGSGIMARYFTASKSSS